jgi:hypothetical protein
MYPYLCDLKRIELGLISGIPTEVAFSLNTLLLYSMNTHIPFKFEQYPNILDALTGYLRRIVPYKSAVELETLRNITLVVRNLSLNTANVQRIINSKMFERLLEVF